jgi:hypothetical protein
MTTITLDCPLRPYETLHELRLEATCQTTDGIVLSPRSEPLVITVPEPGMCALLAGALLVSVLHGARLGN